MCKLLVRKYPSLYAQIVATSLILKNPCAEVEVCVSETEESEFHETQFANIGPIFTELESRRFQICRFIGYE